MSEKQENSAALPDQDRLPILQIDLSMSQRDDLAARQVNEGFGRWRICFNLADASRNVLNVDEVLPLVCGLISIDASRWDIEGAILLSVIVEGIKETGRRIDGIAIDARQACAAVKSIRTNVVNVATDGQTLH